MAAQDLLLYLEHLRSQRHVQCSATMKTFRLNKAPAQSVHSAWFLMAATKLDTTKAFS